VLLAPLSGAALQPPFSLGNPHAWLDQRAAQLDSALRDVAHNLADAMLPCSLASDCDFPRN
jgi:hypothetical protein